MQPRDEGLDLQRAGSFCLLFALLLCGASRTNAQDLKALGEKDLEARAVAIFSRSCAQPGCHAAPIPQQDMDLSADRFFSNTVHVPSKEQPGLMRIHPGKPDSSYLLMKVKGDPRITGVQMPLIGEKLSPEEVQTLEAWIRSISDVSEARQQAAPVSEPLPFAGWQAVNTPTTRMLPAGSFLFRISHRFNPKIGDGYDAFYGLDGSGIIFLSLGYAVTDDLLLTLGRSNAADDVELQAKYGITRQSLRGGSPVDIAVHGALNWISEGPTLGGRYDQSNFKFTSQLIVAREVSDGIGVSVVPGITFNPSSEKNGDKALFTVGLSGRWRVHGHMSLLAEWVPIVSGYVRTTTFGNDNRFDSWGGGIEFATSGHIFQIIVTNSVGIASDQYLNGGDLDIQGGDMRLGFNIYRILNF